MGKFARYLSMIGAALALGSIIYGSIQIRHIDSRIKKAETESKKLEANSSTLEKRLAEISLTSDRINAEALREHNELAFAQASYQRIADKLPNGAAQDAILRTAMADPQSAQITPIIYIRIARENQLPEVKQIQDKLSTLGYQVPAIECVGVRAPQHTQLRFFVRTDEGPAMRQILSQLRSVGVDINEQYIKIASGRPQALRPNQFELWFGQDYVAGGAP
jgi:hypothetical protein